jgi:hypothetical protein
MPRALVMRAIIAEFKCVDGQDVGEIIDKLSGVGRADSEPGIARESGVSQTFSARKAAQR